MHNYKRRIGGLDAFCAYSTNLKVLHSSATCQTLQISATLPPNALVLALRRTADAGPEPGLQNGAARSLCGPGLNTSLESGLQNFWFHSI